MHLHSVEYNFMICTGESSKVVEVIATNDDTSRMPAIAIRYSSFLLRPLNCT